MAIVNEVVTKFSFVGNLKPGEEFNKNLGDSIKLLAGFGAASITAAGAFAGWINNTLSGLDPMIQLSRETGVAIESIQELGYAASVSGSSAQAMQASIRGLSQTIGKAAQFGSAEFSRLGISVRDTGGQVKTADKIIAELSKRFDELNLSMPERQSFAQSLGIDASLVQLLSATSGQLGELRKKARDLGVITKEQADLTASYNDSLTTLKFAFGSVQNAIAIGFAPELKKITEGVIEFLSANKDAIINGITKFGEGINVVAGAVVRLTPLLAALAAGFVVFRIASIGLGTILATVFSPVVLITAGIVALLLAVDDLIVAFQGGDSVIADFFAGFGIDIVKELTDAFEYLSNILSTIWEQIKPIIEAIKTIGSSALGYLFGGDETSGETGTARTVPQPQPQMLTIPVSQAMGTSMTSSIQNNKVEQSVNVNISTTDPLRAGTAVVESLNNQLTDAQTQFNRGGR